MSTRGRSRPRRRRRKAPSEMRDALVAALSGAGLTDQARRLRIEGVWEEVVGDRIAHRAAPRAFSRGLLTVGAANAAWQSELSFMAPQLIARLNAALASRVVREIKIVAGLPRRVAAPAPIPRRAATAEERAAVEQVAQVIEDPELRASFAHLMEAARVAPGTPDES